MHPRHGGASPFPPPPASHAATLRTSHTPGGTVRHTIALLAACLLLAGAAVGCSKSYDEKVEDCATALAERTGSGSTDTPTRSEAEERVDALDKTLARMVRSGYAGVAKNASDAVEKEAQEVEKKAKEGGQRRPEACEPLLEDDYTEQLMARAIGNLGWTGEGGGFDKNKMLDGISKYE